MCLLIMNPLLSLCNSSVTVLLEVCKPKYHDAHHGTQKRLQEASDAIFLSYRPASVTIATSFRSR